MLQIRTLVPAFVIALIGAAPAIRAEPLESPQTIIGAPLLLYQAPCFLYLQPETPLGVQTAYEQQSGSLVIRGGFAKASGSTGLGVGMEATPDDNMYRISFAGSQLLGPLAIGTDIDLIATRRFDAGVGLSVGHAIAGKHFLCLDLSDLMVTDTTISGRQPALRAVGSLALSEKMALGADLQVGARFVQPRSGKIGYLVGADIQKDFLKSRALTAYCGGYGEIRPNLPDIALIHAGLGVRFPVGTAAFALYGGYAYDYDKTKTAVTVSIVANPTFGRNRAAPTVSVSIQDSILQLSAPPQQQHIVLSLSCKDGESGSGIIRWILIISRDYDGHAIERAFSGGGPAPATILWDGRASNGSLCEPGVYFARLSAVDQRRNIGQSPPIRLVVQN